ncbi:hypothetical protein DKX38_006388 [Salix brachista]|uniref:Pentatricopeptide repeat-containing protein n=1 Tax=Salix brachista TaxID=2182728 RepID=A0A5N5N4P0_9ROSI|nr:hypothetical protein DKX38_006388 [Salix brachista]
MPPGYAKLGMKSQARKLFDKMLKRDVVSWILWLLGREKLELVPVKQGMGVGRFGHGCCMEIGNLVAKPQSNNDPPNKDLIVIFDFFQFLVFYLVIAWMLMRLFDGMNVKDALAWTTRVLGVCTTRRHRGGQGIVRFGA